MDMHLGTDLYESARKYQWRLIREYNRLSRQYGFTSIDARLSPDEIQGRIRRHVQAFLEERRVQSLAEAMTNLRPLLFSEPAAEGKSEPAVRKGPARAQGVPAPRPAASPEA
jgi:hypothetical protein